LGFRSKSDNDETTEAKHRQNARNGLIKIAPKIGMQPYSIVDNSTNEVIDKMVGLNSKRRRKSPLKDF
jgi:hypothetical protein